MKEEEIKNTIALAERLIVEAKVHLYAKAAEPFRYHHSTSRKLRKTSFALTEQLAEMRRK